MPLVKRFTYVACFPRATKQRERSLTLRKTGCSPTVPVTMCKALSLCCHTTPSSSATRVTSRTCTMLFVVPRFFSFFSSSSSSFFSFFFLLVVAHPSLGNRDSSPRLNFQRCIARRATSCFPRNFCKTIAIALWTNYRGNCVTLCYIIHKF